MPRVRLTNDAAQDIRALQQVDERLARTALHMLRRIASGELRGQELHNFGKTGDLSDCRKVYFGLHPTDKTHRIVLQDLGSHVDVLQVIVVGERAEDFVYLMAALRLDRLPQDRVRRAHQVIARILRQRPQQR